MPFPGGQAAERMKKQQIKYTKKKMVEHVCKKTFLMLHQHYNDYIHINIEMAIIYFNSLLSVFFANCEGCPKTIHL